MGIVVQQQSASNGNRYVSSCVPDVCAWMQGRQSIFEGVTPEGQSILREFGPNAEGILIVEGDEETQEVFDAIDFAQLVTRTTV